MTVCLVAFVAGLHFSWFVGFCQTLTGGSKSVSPLLKMVSGVTMVEYRRLVFNNKRILLFLFAYSTLSNLCLVVRILLFLFAYICAPHACEYARIVRMAFMHEHSTAV